MYWLLCYSVSSGTDLVVTLGTPAQPWRWLLPQLCSSGVWRSRALVGLQWHYLSVQ